MVYVTDGKIENNFRKATRRVGIGSTEDLETALDQIILELKEFEWDKQTQSM